MCNDADKLAYKSYDKISFQKILSISQITSVLNAIFQMKSTERLAVFPLRKIFKNLILLLFTKYYLMLLCNRYENLKIHEVAYLSVS